MKRTASMLVSMALLAGSVAVIASNEPAGGEPTTEPQPSVSAPKATSKPATGAVSTPAASTTQRSASGASSDLYEVEGDKVDDKTLAGWKTWRALACERCHGAEQEGLVGPALRDTLKTMSKEDFHTTIMNGRIEKGMPPFNTSKMVTDNWENLYAYLKGRADGKIPPGRLQPLEK